MTVKAMARGNVALCNYKGIVFQMSKDYKLFLGICPKGEWECRESKPPKTVEIIDVPQVLEAVKMTELLGFDIYMVENIPFSQFSGYINYINDFDCWQSSLCIVGFYAEGAYWSYSPNYVTRKESKTVMEMFETSIQLFIEKFKKFPEVMVVRNEYRANWRDKVRSEVEFRAYILPSKEELKNSFKTLKTIRW